VFGTALELDALRSTHAIEVPLPSIADIGEIFDTVSYAKGASVIRMTANFVGTRAYHRATSRFIRENASGNVTSFDWWSSLGNQVRDTLRDWTLQEVSVGV
jgi:aminopeptidase N